MTDYLELPYGLPGDQFTHSFVAGREHLKICVGVSLITRKNEKKKILNTSKASVFESNCTSIK